LLFLFDTFDRHDAEAGDRRHPEAACSYRKTPWRCHSGRSAYLNLRIPNVKEKQSALEEASETDSPRAS
jgi:hypothetical protein